MKRFNFDKIGGGALFAVVFGGTLVASLIWGNKFQILMASAAFFGMLGSAYQDTE